MKNFVRYFLLFMGAWLLLTILCCLFWNHCIENSIYKSSTWILTPSDYLSPGRWIGDGAESVAALDPYHSFKDDAQILEGWDKQKLWVVWWILLTSSIAGSSLISSWLGKNTN